MRNIIENTCGWLALERESAKLTWKLGRVVAGALQPLEARPRVGAVPRAGVVIVRRLRGAVAGVVIVEHVRAVEVCQASGVVAPGGRDRRRDRRRDVLGGWRVVRSEEVGDGEAASSPGLVWAWVEGRGVDARGGGGGRSEITPKADGRGLRRCL